MIITVWDVVYRPFRETLYPEGIQLLGTAYGELLARIGRALKGDGHFLAKWGPIDLAASELEGFITLSVRPDKANLEWPDRVPTQERLHRDAAWFLMSNCMEGTFEVHVVTTVTRQVAADE